MAFSDAVFAITITLLILEIERPSDDRHLLHGLFALWPSYLAYTVSFLFIGQVWANHHVMFDHIRAADHLYHVALPAPLSGVYAGSTSLSIRVFGRHRGGADSVEPRGFARPGATPDGTG